MSIQYKVLGKPGRDNALFVSLNSGSRLYRILFDCGENIFYSLKHSDIKLLDHLFLSHLHIDHIAGFDFYFRRVFDRDKPNFIWGPKGTADILQNRFRGFNWNLIDNAPGEFIISEISESDISTYRFVTSEAYSKKHEAGNKQLDPEKDKVITVMDNDDFAIHAVELNHRIPSLAYRITEKDSLNINKEALQKTGLTPGAWLEKIRDLKVDNNSQIEIDGGRFNIGGLRSGLLRITKGNSIAYLTDFVMDDISRHRAQELIKDCTTVVCESQYLSEDLELASKNYHLTAGQAAELAKDAHVKKLILFHISERYITDGSYFRILDEAKKIFSEAYFSETWTR